MTKTFLNQMQLTINIESFITLQMMAALTLHADKVGWTNLSSSTLFNLPLRSPRCPSHSPDLVNNTSRRNDKKQVQADI